MFLTFKFLAIPILSLSPYMIKKIRKGQYNTILTNAKKKIIIKKTKMEKVSYIFLLLHMYINARLSFVWFPIALHRKNAF